MKRGVIAWCALILVVVVAIAAHADRVVLKDGRIFEGRVVKETRTSVEFEALISNISTTMTFSKREIESIEKGEVPGKITKAKTPAPARERKDRTREKKPRANTGANATRYLEIPIVGQFGVEIAPKGVADTLDYARKRGIEHIVFRMDSGGGFVWAANEIADVMDEYHEGLTYHVVIEQAISASIWIVFGCDEIYVLPSGRVGAAVVFSQDRTTGAAEVDAKMNSAIAGTLAARAYANGHSPEIVRAMVLPESAVYAVEQDGGGYELTDQKPSGEHVVLDTDKTVLTLTSEEAVRYGIAQPLVSMDVLGEVAGLDGWTKFSEYGEAAMRKAARSLAKSKGELDGLLAKVQPLVRVINRSVDEATKNDPRDGDYGYELETGAFSSFALREWRSRTNTSISAWERAIDGCQKLRLLKKKCEKFGVDFDGYFENHDYGGDWDHDLIELESRGHREIKWLKENINRNSI